MDQAAAQGLDGGLDDNGEVTDTSESHRLSLAFSTWHRLLRTLLVVHVPLLAVFAYFREIDTVLWVVLLAVPLLLVAASSSVGSERFRASLIAIGFSWCSWLLIVWSGGAIEAHFHALIIIGLVGLYRDWVALAIVTIAQIVLHLGIAPLDPSLIYNHEAAIESPLTWGFVQLCAILGAAAVPVFSWRGTREAEDHSAERATEVVREAAEGQRQRAVASVYATVARRSQTLLERQLDLIEKLEQDEKDPDTLQDLFSLDHLATRMNREAASMLILAGGEPNRRVVGRPPMSEVARGAIGEIEDYTRVDLELTDDRTVEGRVVAPLVHLLSELVENAASYSPPDSRVRVVGSSAADGSFVLRIVDRGIGIDPDKLAHYNHLLTNPRSTSFTDSQRLGLDVVARLAGRYSLPVQLAPNPDGGGTVATVLVPGSLLSAPAERVLATAPPAAEMPMPTAPDDLLDEVPADGKSEPALPTMEPAPPVPVAAASDAQGAAPAAQSGMPAGAPAWAQATARASSGEPQAPAAGSGRPATQAPAPASPAMPTSRPSTGLAWSYSGHLTGEVGPEPPPKVKPAKPKRRGRFSRKSRAEAPDGATGQPAATGASAPVEDENPIQAPDDLDALLNATRMSARAPGSPAAPAQPTGPAAPAAPTTPQAPAAEQTPTESPAAEAQAATGSTPSPEAPDNPRAAAAAALLDDLPGMGSAGPPASRPAPRQVGMPPEGGRGPSVPPQQPLPARPQPDGRPAVGQPSGSGGPGAGERPTVGSVSARDEAPPPAASRPAQSSTPPPDKPAGPAAAPLPTRTPTSGGEPPATTAPTVSGGDVRPAPIQQAPAAKAEPPAEPPVAEPTKAPSEKPTSEIGTPLPKRRRGAALPATLRNPQDGPQPAAAAAAPVSREQSRNLLSSFQSRLQAGRKAAEEQVSNPNDSPSADADAPGEET